MAAKEKDIMNQLMLEASRRGDRLWRNNTGQAWQGKPLWTGDLLILRGPRPINFGLCKGSSDLIGYTKVKVTEDMVGKEMAVFTAVEVKTARTKATNEQETFLKVIRDAGGLASTSTVKKTNTNRQELIQSTITKRRN